jgi:hypothetical protein
VASWYRYRLYGLTLCCPLVLPCPRVEHHDRADVRLGPGNLARFACARAEVTSVHNPAEWFVYRKLTDGSRYLRWTGLFEFLISPDGRRIRYRRLERATPESFAVYLLGQVLSFSLLAFGIEPLHGTATLVDDNAVVFLGGCGWGKSTLAAALLARGFPVLTDDLVALAPRDTVWAVHPGIPRLKLFPSVARRVLGTEVVKPRMNNGTSKLVLPLAAGQAARQVVPVKALYLLPYPRMNSRAARVRIESLSDRNAFLEVVGAAFNLIVSERERLANQFTFAMRLTASVPVRRLVYPRRLSALPAVCDAVVADVAATGTRQSAQGLQGRNGDHVISGSSHVPHDA